MQRHKRVAVFLFIALLVLNSWSSVLVSANGRAGSVNTFAGGFSNVDITLQGSAMDNTSVIEIPRNVTFDSASFLVQAEAGEISPGSVWLDIDQDGSHEWAFTGTGYGNLAHQNTFNDSSTSKQLPTTRSPLGPTIVSANWHTSDPVLLPHSAVLSTADLNMAYSPQIGGGMLPIGQIDDMVTGDFNNDSSADIAILSQDNNTTGAGTAISLVSWNATSGLTNTTWTTTCDNATYSNAADLNNDGLDDVATFALADDLACIHVTNASTGIPGPKLEIKLLGGARDAGFADFTTDGFADLISIHPSGKLSVRKYSNKTTSFAENVTTTVYGDGVTTVANLSQVFIGSVRTGGNISAVVVDNTGYGSEVIWVGNSPYVTTNTFDGLGLNIITGDIDNDGDMDFISERPQGGSAVTKLGWNGWDTDTSNRNVNLINATIADHDGDGNNSLMMVSPGLSDGNLSTVEGQIDFKDIYYHSSGNNRGWRVTSSASHPSAYPWSIPLDIILGDMDGDGLDEQIIIAGEGNLTGLYISAWHTIEVDFNKDGISELNATGYAGDGVLGQPPLVIEDQFGEMYQILSPQMGVGGYTTDGYGISMSQYDFNFTANSIGSFNLSQLDFGYDFDFRVDINPHSSGNLTNIFNQRQTGGLGIINVPLAFNSTLAGDFTIKSLAAEYQDGAPNLALPPTPILVLGQLTSELLVLEWQDSMAFGLDLVEFEIFRVASGTPIDLNTVFSNTPLNLTLDSSITSGETYDYAVRSLHIYGITSNLSAILSVTIPYPSPPSAITGVMAQDTANDGGGSLDISWLAGDDTIAEYKLYINTMNVSNLSSTVALASHSGTVNPDILSATVSCCALDSQLVDGTAYWVSVIGYDSIGNTTDAIQSFGPVYTRNDTIRPANLTWNISASTHQQQMHLEAAGPLDVNLNLMADGQPIEGEQLWFKMEHPMFTQNFTGTTDANGNWQAISVAELSELSSVIFGMVGDVEFSAGYEGSNDNILLQPINNSTINQTISAQLHSIVTADSTIQLDEDNSFSTIIKVDSPTAGQQFLLEGVQYSWEINTIDGDLTSSGTEEVKGGEIEISGFALENTVLRVWTLNTSSWLDNDNDNFTISFLAWVDDTVVTNETGNETQNNTDTWEPTTISSVTLTCPIQNYLWATNATEGIMHWDIPLVCTITNPNPFEVSVEILLGDQGAIEFTLGTQTTYIFAANESDTMVFSVIRNGPSTGLFAGNMGVPWTITSTATEWNLEIANSGEINWNLESEIIDNSEVETNKTAPTSTKSNTPLFIGIGAFIVLAIIVGAVVFLKPKDDDFDFGDEDWSEEETALTTRPQPDSVVAKTSKPLDELKAEGAIIEDDAPAGPSSQLFDEVDGGTEYHSEVVETEQIESAEQSEDGITVDEKGTEWYEDEVGVWWYREQGWQDWAEWQD
ncbi:MAG: hypothetical protein QMC43_05500 [Candidatus Poseidoniaceae archaeon]